jgi:AcrR family transcriptional regulator
MSQKLRTRRVLIDVAIELTRQGRSPSVAEVADAAKVSRATAYRYFPSSEALALQVAADLRGQVDEKMFDGLAADDVPARAERMVRELSGRIFGDESLYRNMLRASLELGLNRDAEGQTDVPVRQRRRREWIGLTVQPLQDRLDRVDRERLEAALALVCGTEAMIVMRDVCELDADAATEVLAWAARALTERAIADAESPRNRP